ncbi:uncharacterized protein HD556DRAFT_96692 [Suillus plorans]|uniref:Uncharacterized protein n=1 Tax=Suillus plorans TaxID=116603 RepID=A0A9P7AAY3_9AGAM|nr:uncharacterized protein HD556DRAFT_96692 [Suillus plorans]KAG1785679.1 hypothetical protein HD556DRAFT_96692 [Suillus plorans]
MADSSPHAITSLEALAVILLADAETPDDQLFAATISLQALDAYLPHRLIVHGQHIFWGVVVTLHPVGISAALSHIKLRTRYSMPIVK